MSKYETLNEALIACVMAAGGSKVVGPILWPEKTQDPAQRLLLDCLNEDRPAKLSPEQVLLILKLAREKGFHDGLNYMADFLGYGTPVPVDPRDEVADLMREFKASIDRTESLVSRMERAAARVDVTKGR